MQGRAFGPAQLEEIRRLLEEQPSASRYRLSRQLALRWEWRSAAGQLKDMAARTLLLKLHQRGWIRLPPCRIASPTRSGRQRSAGRPFLADTSAIQTSLADLGALRIEELSRAAGAPRRVQQLEAALEQYHYLGYRSRVGENLQYWVSDARERPLACVVFGAAAWQCAVRDQWIGWNHAQRAGRLGGIANNTRFLIFPWIKVKLLASHILGRIARRIGADWQAKYQHPIHLLETFVDSERFTGTCYRAANWLRLGQTRGRGRQGPSAALRSTSLKDLYVLELHSHARHVLCLP